MTTTSRPLAKVKFTTCGAVEVEDVIAVQSKLAGPARPAAMRRDHDGPATYKPPFGFSLAGRFAGAGPPAPPLTGPRLQRLLDLIEGLRILDRRRGRPGVSIGDLLYRAAQDLARAGFRQTGHDEGHLEGGDRADLVAHQLNNLLLDLCRRTIDAGFQDHKPTGRLAFDLVLDAKHSAFCNVRVRSHDLLHSAGRQAVAGDVDDVVGPPEDGEIPVLVDETRVSRFVIAGALVEIALAHPLVLAVERWQAARRQRQFDDERTHRPARHGLRRVIDDVNVVARHRHARRAELDREHPQADGIGRDRPAGLGLPPVIDHRDAQNLL